MTFTEAEKIWDSSLNYDNEKIIATGWLIFKDGSGVREQAWSERDIFIKNSFYAHYHIQYCFYRDTTGAFCNKGGELRLCKNESCLLRAIK